MPAHAHNLPIASAAENETAFTDKTKTTSTAEQGKNFVAGKSAARTGEKDTVFPAEKGTPSADHYIRCGSPAAIRHAGNVGVDVGSAGNGSKLELGNIDIPNSLSPNDGAKKSYGAYARSLLKHPFTQTLLIAQITAGAVVLSPTFIPAVGLLSPVQQGAALSAFACITSALSWLTMNHPGGVIYGIFGATIGLALGAVMAPGLMPAAVAGAVLGAALGAGVWAVWPTKSGAWLLFECLVCAGLGVAAVSQLGLSQPVVVA